MNVFWLLKPAGLSLAAAMLSLFVNVLPAEGGIISSVSTRGSTVLIPQQSHVLTNTKDGGPDQVGIGISGDEALSQAFVMGSEGFLTLNSHACSGPPEGGPGGRANALSVANYVEDFIIRSDTLAFGTLVTIDVKVAVASRFAVSLDSDFPVRLGSGTILGDAFVSFGSAFGPTIFRGNYVEQKIDSLPGPNFKTMSGLFASDSGEYTGLVSGRVGDLFRISIATSIGADSGAGHPFGNAVTADADGQMSLMWGADVVGGLAELRSQTDNSVFLPTTHVKRYRAVALLPDRPDYFDEPGPEPVPEPSSLALLSIGGIGMVVGALRRRRQQQTA